MAIQNSGDGPNKNSIWGRLSGIMKGAGMGAKVGGPYGAVVGGILGGANQNNAIATFGDKFGGGGGGAPGVSSGGGAGEAIPGAMGRRMDALNSDLGDKGSEDHKTAFQTAMDALHQVDLDPATKEQYAKIFTSAQTHEMNGIDSSHLFGNSSGSETGDFY